MEGDDSNACHVLFHYNSIIAELRTQRRSTVYSSLNRMIDVMVRKLISYEAEALLCDTIILATILNPDYRLKFFEDKYPDELDRVRGLLDEALAELPEPAPSSTAPQPSESAENQASNPFRKYNAFAQKSTPPATVDIEVDAYLKGKYPCTPGMDHLSWWKVSLFPSLLPLYLLI